MKRYRELGGGWFYAVRHYDAIRGAEGYRKALWDRMGDEPSKLGITTEWSKALVTLKDRNGKLVVSVTFHTEQDGLLDPITAYLDPVTSETVGGEPRY